MNKELFTEFQLHRKKKTILSINYTNMLIPWVYVDTLANQPRAHLLFPFPFHRGLTKYLTAQDTHLSPTSSKLTRSISSHDSQPSLQFKSKMQGHNGSQYWIKQYFKAYKIYIIRLHKTSMTYQIPFLSTLLYSYITVPFK